VAEDALTPKGGRGKTEKETGETNQETHERQTQEKVGARHGKVFERAGITLT